MTSAPENGTSGVFEGVFLRQYSQNLPLHLVVLSASYFGLNLTIIKFLVELKLVQQMLRRLELQFKVILLNWSGGV